MGLRPISNLQWSNTKIIQNIKYTYIDIKGKMVSKFHTLPLDCVNHILGYDKRFVIRKGMVVDRIPIHHEKYTPLLSIPEKDKKYKYNNQISVYIQVNINKDFLITYEEDFTDTRRFILTVISYVFDEDGLGNGHIDYPKTKRVRIEF